MFDNIVRLTNLFYKLASINYIVTFHGTNAKNLTSIAQKGLVPNSPLGGTKGVYLTNDFETSAYYAARSNRNEEFPVVLEMVLHKNKRIKRLQHDDLDREYLAGGQYSEPEPEEAVWEWELNRLHNSIKKIINIKLDFTYDISELDGINIYKLILNKARKDGLDTNKIKQLIKEHLPPQELEYIEITNDGTIKMTEAYYDSLHQMVYDKWIPSKAIKYVWVPEDRVRPLFKKLAIGSKESGYKILSGELGDMRDELRQISSSCWKVNSDKLLEMLEKVKELDEYDLFKNDIGDLEQYAKEGNWEKFIDWIEWTVNEELDFGTVAGERTWLKFAIGNGLQLGGVINLYA
jgi:hypothetical protein